MKKSSNLSLKTPKKLSKPMNNNVKPENIMQELKYIKSTIQEIKEHVLEITINLNKITKNKQTTINGASKEKEVNLPTKTVRELEELDRKAGEDIERFNAMFKKIVSTSGGSIEKSIKHIITSDMALKYNFKGLNDKRSFEALKNINICLYNAVKSDVVTREVYIKSVMQGLRRMKNLYFKRKELEKLKETAAKDEEMFID